MKTKLQAIEVKIEKVKRDLLELGPMRPGSLTRQVRRKENKPYGEYWHLSYTHAGKGRTEYVPPPCVQTIEKEIQNYRRFKALLENLISHSIELSRLKMEIAKQKFLGEGKQIK